MGKSLWTLPCLVLYWLVLKSRSDQEGNGPDEDEDQAFLVVHSKPRDHDFGKGICLSPMVGLKCQNLRWGV